MELIRRLLVNRELRKKIADSRDRLYRVALAWCGDSALADDLVQETLMISLQQASQLRDPGKLKAWMHVILRNCWKKHLGRDRQTVDFEEAGIAGEHDVESACSQQEIVDQVRTAILRLPVTQRETLTFVDLAGFSYAEVAAVLDVPIGTVMSRLYTARQSLQKTLAKIHAATPEGVAYLRRVK